MRPDIIEYLENMDNSVPAEVMVAGRWELVNGTKALVHNGDQKRTHLTLRNGGTVAIQNIQEIR